MLQCPGRHARNSRWQSLVVVILAVYVVVLFLHLQNFSSLSLLRAGEEDPARWNNSTHLVDGEFILGTHDAYRWAAGAVGVGSGRNETPSRFLAGLSALTGKSVGSLAFWLPILAAGLVAVVAALWAWSLGGAEAGLVAGVVAGLAPGFFYRTRLGYYDTDMVTLLGPLFVAWALAKWMSPWLHPHLMAALSRWRAGRGRDATGPQSGRQPEDEDDTLWGLSGAASMTAMACAGLLARYLGMWHQHILTYAMVTYVMALALALVLGKAHGAKEHALWGLSVFGLAAFLGWIGLGGAVAIMIFKGLPRAGLPGVLRSLWPALGVALVVLLLMGGTRSFYGQIRSFVDAYSKPTVQAEGMAEQAAHEVEQAPRYPAVGQSIIEAQNIDVRDMFFKMHAWVWVAVVGILGFVALLLLRHQLVLILPLLVLALMAWKYGTRTAMFGGPAVGLGLALPYCLSYTAACRPEGHDDWAGSLTAWIALLAGGVALWAVAADPLGLVFGCWFFALVAAFAVTRILDQGKPLPAFSPLSVAALAAVVVLAAVVIVLTRLEVEGAWWHGLVAGSMGALMPVFWLLNKRWAGRYDLLIMRWVWMTLLAGVLVFPYFQQYPRLAPTPVMANYHALALKELRALTPEDAVIWTWWDWGYATNYYARRASFADGAHHDGEVILPLGLALSTSSPLQSRQVILFSAEHNYQPWVEWNTLSAQGLAGFLDRLAVQEIGYTSPREQYVVATLENVRLLPWIGYFGLWDVVNGESDHPMVFRLRPGEMEVDAERGMLRDTSNEVYPFQSMDVCTWDGRDHREYPDNANGMHLVMVQPTGDAWILGPRAYDSMLVRLLLSPVDAPDITANFELTLDIYPLVRVWRVRQEPGPLMLLPGIEDLLNPERLQP